MRVRFAALAASFGLATVGLLAAGAQAGYASIVATSGSATSVTSTSAILNGVALTLNPSSAWLFQYGTSSSYGQYSHGSSVALGLTAVSETVSNLTPNTTYHFRLVVVQGDPGNANDYSSGNDVTFTTAPAPPAYGTTSVESHRLAVKGGLTSIRFACSGGHGSLCKGKVALVARNSRGGLVNCGSGALVARGGDRHAIESRLGRACMALLSKSHSHTLSGEVRVTLSGTQHLVRSLVTLVGSVVSNGAGATATLATSHHSKSHHSKAPKHHHARRHKHH